MTVHMIANTRLELTLPPPLENSISYQDQALRKETEREAIPVNDSKIFAAK